MSERLREVEAPRQYPGEAPRRIFWAQGLELYVWYDDARSRITGFQLCYGDAREKHSLIWKEPGRYIHERVDEGEELPTRNRTPICVADGEFEPGPVLARFREAAVSIDPAVADFVCARLAGYPAPAAPRGVRAAAARWLRRWTGAAR